MCVSNSDPRLADFIQLVSRVLMKMASVTITRERERVRDQMRRTERRVPNKRTELTRSELGFNESSGKKSFSLFNTLSQPARSVENHISRFASISVA